MNSSGFLLIERHRDPGQMVNNEKSCYGAINRAGGIRMLRRTAICLAVLLGLTAFRPPNSYAEGKAACEKATPPGRA
jgi:hypothetical protein